MISTRTMISTWTRTATSKELPAVETASDDDEEDDFDVDEDCDE